MRIGHRLLRTLSVVAFPWLLAAAPLAAQGGAAPHYRVARQVTLGGEGGWDYLALDTAASRLFIVRSDRVMVVDPASGRVLGEIRGLQRGHGVALAYPAGHGFATSGGDGTVVMFDLKTLAVLKRTAAAPDADAVLWDPPSNRVLTFDGESRTSTVIDAASGDRLGTIDLGGEPEFGVADGRGHVFVNITDRGEVAEIDPRAMTVTRRWSVRPCANATGLAIDVAHERLFSACRDRIMAISDAARGRLVTTVPIGAGVDGAGFDPATGDAFASNGEGTLTVVHEEAPDRFTVVETVPTMRGARTMTLDPRTHTVYTVSARFGAAPTRPTADNPRRRPPMLPGSFTLLVLER